MSDRCWRQTRSTSSATGVREIYPSDGTGDQFFKLPSIVKAFGVTIPSGAFGAQAGNFILGIIEFKSHYEFSQRRTDISSLVDNIVRDKEEAARQSQREDLRKKLAIVENPVKAAELNVE